MGKLIEVMGLVNAFPRHISDSHAICPLTLVEGDLVWFK